ncbi:MAG: hypothetical protein LBR95_02210 [Azoarcus sp.]|jgi:hypothetical protein|nr:hypothetical protein [Azoarcus sp.]
MIGLKKGEMRKINQKTSAILQSVFPALRDYLVAMVENEKQRLTSSGQLPHNIDIDGMLDRIKTIPADLLPELVEKPAPMQEKPF